jgi:hypothetical protein
VLALGAALAIAVWEFLRTRRAEVRRREDLVRVARDLTEFVVKLTIELEKPEYFTQLTVAHGEDAEAHYKADVVNLKNQIRMTMDVVEALVPQVLEARLSLDLVNLKYAYKVGLSNYVLGDARVQSAEHRDVGLDALRRLREPLQELLAKLK